MNQSPLAELSLNTQIAFNELKTLAARDQINLTIVSGYRSAARQLAIWQRKAQPDYAFLIGGKTYYTHQLSSDQWLDAVLTWSAIPGLSRHHWRSDIDVADQTVLDQGYKLQLTPDEYGEDGPMHRLGKWLNQYIDEDHTSAFFRPYRTERNGIAIEPWHLSHYQEANEHFQKLTEKKAFELVPWQDIPHAEALQKRFSAVYNRFVINIDTVGNIK